MNSVVLDASALLALLNQEVGHLLVQERLDFSRAIMSAVNVAEVITVLIDSGVPQVDAEAITAELLTEIVPFDYQQAGISASLQGVTKSYGLSLGDRACLALAQIKKLPVLTADKNWQQVKAMVHVELIR